MRHLPDLRPPMKLFKIQQLKKQDIIRNLAIEEKSMVLTLRNTFFSRFALSQQMLLHKVLPQIHSITLKLC